MAHKQWKENVESGLTNSGTHTAAGVVQHLASITAGPAGPVDSALPTRFPGKNEAGEQNMDIARY